MPDFERVFDDLTIHMAKTPEEKAYVRGHIAGKKHARKQIFYISLFVIVIYIIGLSCFYN